MIQLLKEMNKEATGMAVAPSYFGASDDDFLRHQHLRLLVEAGQAEWQSSQKDIASITNKGYDFLSAIEHAEGALQKFNELCAAGIPYEEATQAAVRVASENMAEVTQLRILPKADQL